MDERLEKIQRHAIPRDNGVFDVYHLRDRDYEYLIQQAKKTHHYKDILEKINDYVLPFATSENQEMLLIMKDIYDLSDIAKEDA